MEITDARIEDAPFIADAIMSAVGKEICEGIAGDEHNLEDVKGIFTRLASMKGDESQYSYENTRIALDDKGELMGACVSYDGGNLKKLRLSFFAEAKKTLGWKLTEKEIESVPPETTPDEFYLDTLAVLPEFRKRGVGKALIEDAAERARNHRLPLGLLVEKENERARRLYDSVGFRFVNERPFAGVEMNHLQLN